MKTLSLVIKKALSMKAGNHTDTHTQIQRKNKLQGNR